jgi:hypothetical protein
MIELVIAAGLLLVPLFLAIPLLGKYLDMRAAAVQTSRYAAWERTVWYGGNAASSLGWFGVSKKWQANEKDDTKIRNEIGVRLLSETTATTAFASSDRDAGAFSGGVKTIWQDRNGKKLLENYDDVQNAVANQQAPGTLNLVLDPIANFASTLGPFVLETKGEYAATVTVKVKDIDYNSFLALNSTATFSESNVLLANGWSANGPADTDKTSVKQQVKGLVPTSVLNAEVAGVNVMEYVLKVLSVFLPEVSKLEPGKIEPEVVPADRTK